MSMSPISVLHLTLNMDVGGAEVMIRHLVEGVDTQTFVSSIACVDGRAGAIGKAMRRDGYMVHDLGRGAGFDWVLLSMVRQLLKERHVDILHCHQYTPFCYGVMAAFGTSTKVIFTEHGRFHPDRYTWKRRLINQILCRLTDRVTTISAATRDALSHYEWFPHQQIEVIYNGVKPLKPVSGGHSVRQRLDIPEDAFLLGTLSRLDSIKNQRMMLYAIHELQGQLPNIVLLLAGDGPEREALTSLVDELDLQARVRFAGFVTDIADHLDAMDVFLLTSFSEGTSMTLLEAMCLGKAIVATRVGGNMEVIDDQVTGVLIDSDDITGLISAIQHLAIDEAWGAQLGKQAQDVFHDRFDLKHMVSKYEHIYASIVNR